MNTRRAFSLTEILVVIAIIAIVAALLFPVFAQARLKAKETVCVSNLRQLYTAAKLYQEANGDYPPDGMQTAMQAQYLGNTRLHCFAQKDERLAWDYLVSGPISLAPATIPDAAELFNRCREIRGGQFPVVSDSNHKGLVEGYQAGRRFYLLAREDGNVSTVDAKRYEQMLGGFIPVPCDVRLSVLNL